LLNLLTPSEVAALFAVSRKLVWKWTRFHGLEYHTRGQKNLTMRRRAGSRRWSRIEPGQLRAFLRDHRDLWHSGRVKDYSHRRIAAFVEGSAS